VIVGAVALQYFVQSLEEKCPPVVDRPEVTYLIKNVGYPVMIRLDIFRMQLKTKLVDGVVGSLYIVTFWKVSR